MVGATLSLLPGWWAWSSLIPNAGVHAVAAAGSVMVVVLLLFRAFWGLGAGDRPWSSGGRERFLSGRMEQSLTILQGRAPRPSDVLGRRWNSGTRL